MQGQLAGLGVAGQALGGLRIRIGVLEQPCQELETQAARHGLVDKRLVDDTRAHLLDQQQIGVAVRELDVDTRRQRLRRRILERLRHVMPPDELGDRVVVGHHHPFESPFTAQHVTQQPLVDVRRNTVDLVVGGHDELGTGLLDRPLEGREEDLAQDAFGDVGRTHVGATLGLAMARHVLQRRKDPILRQRQGPALEATHGGEPHLGDQKGVFAIGFLDAAPTRFTGVSTRWTPRTRISRATTS